MTAYDERVAAVLDSVRPAATTMSGDWARVIADAQPARGLPPSPRTSFFWPRRRLVLVTVTVAVGLAIPLLAIATNGWWFQRPQPFSGLEAKPISGVPGIIATEQSQGEHWTAIGYISKRVGFRRVAGKLHPIGGYMVCVGIISGSLSNTPAAEGCGSLYGMKGHPQGKAGGWVTFMNSSRVPALIGATARGVARLSVVLNPNPYPNGKVRTITVPLKSIPEVGGGIHFFIVSYPTAVGISALIVYDTSGNVLKRLSWG
jgi:hypothetical protein